MIICVGGIKGGCGKTTIATNLTVLRSANKKVLLVDADEQKSASDWATHRESLGCYTPWTTITLSGASLRHQVQKMKSDYDDIIIDTGGRDTTSHRSALSLADIFIVPLQPRSFDVWTIGSVLSLVEDIRPFNQDLKVITLINRADAQGKDNDACKQIIKESMGIDCLDCMIGQRKAFANAASEGLGVSELDKQDEKAVMEMLELYKHVFDTKFNHSDTKMNLYDTKMNQKATR